MTNKFQPLNICPNCNKKIWDYDEEKDTTICKAYKNGAKIGCGTEIKKKLHPLIGASIDKNEQGLYVLEFEQYGETDIYPDWESLKQAMNKLADNEV